MQKNIIPAPVPNGKYDFVRLIKQMVVLEVFTCRRHLVIRISSDKTIVPSTIGLSTISLSTIAPS